VERGVEGERRGARCADSAWGTVIGCECAVLGVGDGRPRCAGYPRQRQLSRARRSTLFYSSPRVNAVR